MKKIAFLTTIFPMPDKYLYDFFDSLEKQTYKDFDIIVVNDKFQNFKAIQSKYHSLHVTEIPYSNTPAKNREYGINYCIGKKYDILIFGDSDDYFSQNRVEKSIELLQEIDIVVNDLSLLDENGIYEECYISHRIQNKSMIEYDFIKDKNIFGLSNSAINTHILTQMSFPSDTVAVDWFLFKKLLSKQNKAIFTNECTTYYRQHKNNTIGLNHKNGKYQLWWEDK